MELQVLLLFSGVVDDSMPFSNINPVLPRTGKEFMTWFV